jgi:hypothetical protein
VARSYPASDLRFEMFLRSREDAIPLRLPTQISKKVYKTDKIIHKNAREQTDLSEDEELDEALDTRKMTGT